MLGGKSPFRVLSKGELNMEYLNHLKASTEFLPRAYEDISQKMDSSYASIVIELLERTLPLDPNSRNLSRVITVFQRSSLLFPL